MERTGQDKGMLRRGEMHPGTVFLLAAVYGAASFSVVLLLGIAGYVFFRGFRELSLRFFLSVTSALKGTVGIAGNMVNTLYMIILTLAMAVPAGVGAAVYLNEYAGKSRPVRAVSFAVDILAGIPSIVFGLFGMVLFGNVMGLGYSLLTGALTLGLMVLPLIVENTQAALQAVPRGYRQGALGMGAGKWELIRTILLPGESRRRCCLRREAPGFCPDWGAGSRKISLCCGIRSWSRGERLQSNCICRCRMGSTGRHLASAVY